MSPLYVAVLGIILLSLLVVSLTQVRKTHTQQDYLLAGRSLPAFVLIFTLLSSWIGSGSLLGTSENAFNNGLVALWQPAGGWAGLLLIYFIAPRARRFAQYTIPDLLEARYSQGARVLGVIAILFAYTAITSYQFIGGGDVLSLIFPQQVTPDLGKYIIAAFVISLTALAGMSSVAYMDLFIGLLATFSLLAAAPVLLHTVGGWAAFHRSLPPSHFTALGDFTPIRALELFHVSAHARQPIHVPKVLLCKISARRPTCCGRLDHRNDHPRIHHRAHCHAGPHLGHPPARHA